MYSLLTLRFSFGMDVCTIYQMVCVSRLIVSIKIHIFIMSIILQLFLTFNIMVSKSINLIIMHIFILILIFRIDLLKYFRIISFIILQSSFNLIKNVNLFDIELLKFIDHILVIVRIFVVLNLMLLIVSGILSICSVVLVAILLIDRMVLLRQLLIILISFLQKFLKHFVLLFVHLPA